MSYTKHTWQNDELITAAKMNNIEQGIAADGGGICMYGIATHNFPNSNNNIGLFLWVKKNGNTYSAMPMFASPYGITCYGNVEEETYWMIPMPIPTLEDCFLVLMLFSGITIEAASGGIDVTSPIIYDEYYSGYIITGDFTLTLSGWL